MFAGFTGGELISLLGVFGGAFLAIGKAIQWYVARFDAKTQKAMQIENDLRRAVEKSFEERIRSLETELEVQRRIIADMNKEKQVYLRRIYQLEATIHLNKIEVPSMEGWPP
jgi:uncharacterized glyoxalase superfamily protein PhnB